MLEQISSKNQKNFLRLFFKCFTPRVKGYLPFWKKHIQGEPYKIITSNWIPTHSTTHTHTITYAIINFYIKWCSLAVPTILKITGGKNRCSPSHMFGYACNTCMAEFSRSTPFLQTTRIREQRLVNITVFMHLLHDVRHSEFLDHNLLSQRKSITLKSLQHQKPDFMISCAMSYVLDLHFFA